MENSNKTFIQKYKPQYLNDFGFDNKFISVVKTFVEIDCLNVLFIGNSSSGKTTLLYSLIREYYGSFINIENNKNILLINNICEQGINFFRNEMKNFCQSYCSIYGKKKMIIVDDLDLINEQSQQVFRNYIDKYENNIMFVSVCTNIQKIIESLQSRLHIIKINQISLNQQIFIMDKILINEKINIDEKTKKFLLFISNNSIRTLINNLEKIFIYSSGEHDYISYDICKDICSNISFVFFENYINCLKLGTNGTPHPSLLTENIMAEDKNSINSMFPDLNEAIKIIYDVFNFGYSVIDILDFFFYFVKNTELLTEDEKYKIIPILCHYITIFYNLHENEIELALLTNSISKVFTQETQKNNTLI